MKTTEVLIGRLRNALCGCRTGLKQSTFEDVGGTLRSQARVLREAGFGEEPKSEGEYMNMIECGLPPKAVRVIAGLRAENEKLRGACRDLCPDCAERLTARAALRGGES